MAKKEKKAESAAAGAPMWMVTYGDMMSLLLTFFVLILSFSSIQDADFNKAMGSLRGSLGILGAHEYLISMGKIVVPEARFAFMTRMNRQTTGQMSKDLNFISEFENVEIYTDNRGLNIILPAEVLYESGKDKLREESFKLLKKIGAFLYEVKDKEIIIEGHTDDKPVNTITFPSNWHLSSARAISVANFLNKECAIDNTRLSVSGYGEFRPIVPNDSEENRAKNRRVSLLLKGEWEF